MTLDEHFIDKRVRTASGSWETPPPSGGWSRIERSLNAQKGARMVLLRRRLTSVAAVLLAFFTGYLIADYNGNDSAIKNQPQISQNSPMEITPNTPEQGIETSLTIAKTQTSETTAAAPSFITKHTKSTISSAENHSRIASTTVSSPSFSLPDIAFTHLSATRTETEPTITIPELQIPALFHRITQLSAPFEPSFPKEAPTIPKTTPDHRWCVAGIAGQTIANYYHGPSLSSENLMYRHDVMASSREKVMNPMSSLGAEVRYQLTSHWGLTGGITMHQFSTTLADVQQSEIATLTSSQPVGNALGQISFNQKIQNDLSKNPVLEVDADRFKQHLSYVEIPLMASWRIADRRLGVGINAGFGTNLLIDNTVTLTEESETRVVGQTEGIKDMYVSSIVSLDLILNLHPKWSWSFTPLYRHALQPVSDNDYDPRIISFGLYTGLNYRF